MDAKEQAVVNSKEQARETKELIAKAVREWSSRFKIITDGACENLVECLTTALGAPALDSKDELTAALNELREMWPNGSFKILASSGLPRFTIMVLPRPHLSVHKHFDGATLSEAMASVREWHQEQSKGAVIDFTEREGKPNEEAS